MVISPFWFISTILYIPVVYCELLCTCSLPLSTVIITAGAISISEMIKINHTLQLLNISWNPIGDEGIAAIATNLKNSMISKLYVIRCEITATGAKSLAECLLNNCTIKLLVVWDNDITVNGAIAILEAAVSNNVCEEVGIGGKYKSNDKVKEMMSILEERKRQEVGSIIV